MIGLIKVFYSILFYSYFTLTQIFSGGKAKVNLHAALILTVFMPISCLMRVRRHLIFERRDVYVHVIV